MHLVGDERGSAATRILYSIIGVISILLGLLLGTVSIFLAVENIVDAEEYIFLALLLLTTIILLGEGVLMFVLPAQIEQAESNMARHAQPSRPQTAQGHNARPKATQNAAEEVVEPVVEPVSVGPASARKASADASRESSAEKTERMILRSEDIFATAKDLIRMQATNPTHERRLTHLSTMLEAIGLLDWEDAPTCSITKLSRTSAYWLRCNTDDLNKLSPGDYDRLIATEAALNVDRALPELATLPSSDPDATSGKLAYLQQIVCQKPHDYDFGPSLDRAYPADTQQVSTGEWLCRASIVNDAECVQLPFRLLHDLRANMQTGTAALWIEIPRPACFAIATTSKSARIAYARAYALRVSWLLASHAFMTVSNLRRIEVLCHEHQSTNVLLATDFSPELVELLEPIVHGSDIDQNSFPHDTALTYSFDDEGWFVPVDPPFAFTDELVAPQEWSVLPELDERLLTPRATEVTGAARPCDLSINENAPRADAANKLVARWHELEQRSCANVVATLVEMRGSSSTVSLVEACDRATKALLDGSVDAADDEALRKILMSDGMLQDAAERAYHLLEDQDHADPEAAVLLLREVLDPIMSIGYYADDESCIYRYFGSVAERLAFNTRIDDHTREVRLVPDSYYNALSFLSSAYTTLGQDADATVVANEMIRIAPASMDAIMRKVRALENQSRILEASELIRSQLPLAITPRDAALGHYRLAYMEWKLGREDLASACYQRALTWDTTLSEQAREELNDLLESYSDLKSLSSDEVVGVLANEDIPLGFTKADQDVILTASTLLVDEHVFVPAVSLISVLCAAEGDDVIVGIRRTLV